jgi:hypothetical protein
VKRWAAAFAIVLILCAFVFAARSTQSGLLKDTDTAVLLRTIASRHAPLSWFGGDWPLNNHFYRPIATLTFEADRALYGSNGAGYAVTNALLAIAAILMLFWLTRELTDSPAASGAAAGLFALWHLYPPGFDALLSALSYVAFAVLLGAFLPGRRLLACILASLVAFFTIDELGGLESFGDTILYWLPGRTASTMTVFALAAMAAYARYERIGAVRKVRAAGPLDQTATKSARVRAVPGSRHSLWAGAACLFLALALGSYEQAVMLPAAMFGVAVYMTMLGYRVRWGVQAAFWGLLVGYLVLRYHLVPMRASGYQLQQFRSGPGVWVSICDFVLPCALPVRQLIQVLDLGWALLVFPKTYQTLLIVFTNVAVAVSVKRRLPLFLVGWILSALVFLPMAWIKPFSHYYYWPMAMRSIMVVALILIVSDLVVSAWSRPALQAPRRSGPAPGLLPHP